MLFRKMLRTIGRYKSQFISMVIMIAIGMGMFLGFNMEWVSLEENTSRFFEKTHFADYRIVSSEGFTADDAVKISELNGVKAASRYISVNADVEGTDNMLGLTVTENPEVSLFEVTKGEPYDGGSSDGIWLFDHYAEKNNVKIGDKLTMKYETLTVSGRVKGLIESGEYLICVRDESQLMPDFKTYGYAYITPKLLKKSVTASAQREALKNLGERVPKEFAEGLVEQLGDEFSRDTYEKIYPQINVISSLDKSDFTAKVEKALDKTLLVLSKDETVAYSESQGEIEEGKTMGSVLPALFLLIAVLTMVTTMHRLAANEKTQIGTLKALGFKDGRILRHYTSFALAIGIVGTAFGIGLGFIVARIIMNPDGMMGTYIVMTDWSLYLPLWCWGVMVLIIAFLTLIGFLSTRKMLQGTAADALRPYVPKKMKRLAIERIRLLDRLSFGTKWNLRDILRHKSRSFMTLFGVLGCTVLIVAGMGMNDTMAEFMGTYYTDIANYSSKIFISDKYDNDDALRVAEKFGGDSCASVSVQLKEEPYTLDVYNIKHSTVRFLAENNEQLMLPDDGALVCLRLRDKYNLAVGDTLTLSPYGTSEKYRVKISGFNRSMSESISISDAYAEKLVSGKKRLTSSEVYRISNVYTQTEKQDINDVAISSIQSKSDIVDSMDSFMEIMYTMIILLIVAAAVLGVIVLYNLGIMSFTERYREMATLKVVGFRDRQIGRLLISQNVWLSALGILLGIPAGYFVLDVLLKMLASEYELVTCLGIFSVVISVAVTLGVSLAVGFIIARKNRKIEPVSALKTSE